MNKTSVVILNYNGREYLQTFLPSVIEHTPEASIIVVDNCSEDDSVLLIQEEFKEVQLIILDKNFGYAGGYNRAINEVKTEYAVLLNSDIEVTHGWLQPMVDFLDQNADYAACQPKMKDYHRKEKFEYAGASGGFIDSMGYPYCRGRIFDTIETDHRQYDNSADIFWATGACITIRTDIFKMAEGLDEDFFAHMEEIDLCWRLQSMGWKNRAIPNSTVYHVGGGTLSKISPFKTYLNFRNGILMLLKNLPLTELIFKLPLRILLDWVAALKFILEGNAKHGLSVIKAHLKIVATFLSTIKKRKLTSSIQGKGFIILDYYLKKKKKFDEL